MRPPAKPIAKSEVFPSSFEPGRQRFEPFTCMSYAYEGPAQDEVEAAIPAAKHAHVYDWIVMEHEINPEQYVWVRCLGDQVMQDHPWLVIRFTNEATKSKFTQEFKDYLS